MTEQYRQPGLPPEPGINHNLTEEGIVENPDIPDHLILTSPNSILMGKEIVKTIEEDGKKAKKKP